MVVCSHAAPSNTCLTAYTGLVQGLQVEPAHLLSLTSDCLSLYLPELWKLEFLPAIGATLGSLAGILTLISCLIRKTRIDLLFPYNGINFSQVDKNKMRH